MQTSELKDFVKMYTSSQNFRARAQNRVSSKLKGGNEEFESRAYETDVQFSRRLNAMVKETLADSEAKMKETFKSKQDVKVAMEEMKAVLEYIKKTTNDMETEAFGKNVFTSTTADLVKKYSKIEAEVAAKCAVIAESENPEIYRWLTAHKGIGPVFASALIAYVGDISRFSHVSSLWQYAGMGMVTRCQNCGGKVFTTGAGAYIECTTQRLVEINSKNKDKAKIKPEAELRDQVKGYLCHCGNCQPKNVVQKQRAGELADYNPDFKKLCFLISDQFVKQTSSPYRKLYDQFVDDYKYNRPDLQAEIAGKKGKKVVIKGVEAETKGTAHINAMARRKVVKIFLSHMWEEWRTIAGLPTPNPWVLEHGGHVDKYKREDFM